MRVRQSITNSGRIEIGKCVKESNAAGELRKRDLEQYRTYGGLSTHRGAQGAPTYTTYKKLTFAGFKISLTKRIISKRMTRREHSPKNKIRKVDSGDELRKIPFIFFQFL